MVAGVSLRLMAAFTLAPEMFQEWRNAAYEHSFRRYLPASQRNLKRWSRAFYNLCEEFPGLEEELRALDYEWDKLDGH